MTGMSQEEAARQAVRQYAAGPQPPDACQHCRRKTEVRPYGPPGKPWICVPCSRATPEIEQECRERAARLWKEQGGLQFW